MDPDSMQCNKDLQSLYEPLNAIKREIRLLEIQATDGPINCKLKRVSLDAYSNEFARYLQDNELGSVCDETSASSWVEHCVERPENWSDSSSVVKLPLWRSSQASLEWEQLRDSLNLENELPNPLHLLLRKPNHSGGEIPRARPEVSSPPETICVFPRFTWGDFEAISYRWESEEKECDISLNGVWIKIPRNLEAALKKVRCLPEVCTGMFVWCDALCIDQENLTEKNQQVGMMKEIYQNAFAVLVWLGAEDLGTTEAVKALVQHHYLQCKITPNSPLEEFQVDRQEHNPLIDLQKRDYWLSNLPWEPLLSFLRRDYWERVWIVQEIALNHHMTLFLSGNQEISRPMILSITNTGLELASVIAKLFEDDEDVDSASSSYSQQAIYQTFAHIRELLSMCNSKALSEPFGLPKVLDLAQRAKCKDAKDKIYGLLGLMSKEANRICFPDYGKSMENLYMDFATFILSSGGLTDLLSWRSSPKSKDLPTWVPDWRTKFSRNHVQWLKKRNADKGKEFLSKIDRKKQTLEIKGILFDSIYQISKSTNESLPYRAVRKSNHKFEIRDKSKQILQNPYGGRAALSVALERTILMNHPKKNQIAISQSSGMFLEATTWLGNIPWIEWDFLPWFDWDLLEAARDASETELLRKDMVHITNNPLWETFDRFRQTNADFSIAGVSIRNIFPSVFRHQHPSSGYLASATKHINLEDPFPNESLKPTELDNYNMNLAVLALEGRRLTTTKKNYIGLVPQEARKGDLVAVVYGCSFPIVLRPATGVHNLSSHSRHFEFVGECYVDGIMDGEALQLAELGNMKEETFFLL